MLEEADATQLDEWIAYSLIEPFGHTDRLLAEIACLLYNINRGEGVEPIRPSAFLPTIDAEQDDGLTPGEREVRALLQQQMEILKRNKT